MSEEELLREVEGTLNRAQAVGMLPKQTKKNVLGQPRIPQPNVRVPAVAHPKPMPNQLPLFDKQHEYS